MIRPVAQNMFDALMFDIWPRMAAVVDFGLDAFGINEPGAAALDAQRHYEALHGPVRAGEITLEQLDAALSDGPALTALVAAAPSNPHKGIVFKTAYDSMRPEPEDDPNEDPDDE